MEIENEVRLLLRFYKDVDEKMEDVLLKFKNFTDYDRSHFNIKLCEDHIWIFIIGAKKRYWSPHLHLELEKKSENETHIRGLFGPDPTLWTLFMFLHFMIAGTFIVFCGIAYTHYVLKESTQWDFIVLSMMIFAWFLLYVIARQIRSNGEKQMNDLEKVFLKIIE